MAGSFVAEPGRPVVALPGASLGCSVWLQVNRDVSVFVLSGVGSLHNTWPQRHSERVCRLNEPGLAEHAKMKAVAEVPTEPASQFEVAPAAARTEWLSLITRLTLGAEVCSPSHVASVLRVVSKAHLRGGGEVGRWQVLRNRPV